MIKIWTYCFFVFLLASGCSVKKYLPPGEKLYRGASITIKKEQNAKISSRSVKSQLKLVARPKTNTFLLGQPYKVWWWYVIGAPKKPTGFKAWLRKTLGEAPVLSSRVKPKATAELMQASLENSGYFHSVVSGDTMHKNEYVKASYTARVFPPYKIKDITWVSDSSPLLIELSKRKRASFLKTDAIYQLSDIEAEKTRLDQQVKTKGYYYFNPNYVMLYADSTIGDRKVNLFLNIKNTTPEKAKHAYTIDRIMLFPNYTLLNPAPDTSKTGTENVDGLLIRDTVKKFRPDLFSRTVTYRPGSLYSSVHQNATLNRFITLGAFKFVKNRFESVPDTNNYGLDVYYYLTPAKKKSIQAEIDAFTKENKYIGTQLSVNWKNRNTFHRAEQLSIRTYGGLEVSPTDSLKINNTYRFGIEGSLVIPRFVTPFFDIKESSSNVPRTQLTLGYEYYIKQSFYAKNVFHLQYSFDWKETPTKKHTFAPIAFSYLNASNVTDSFYAAARLTPSILLNVYSEAILGSFYTYTYNNTLNPNARKQWYFTGGLDLAGNIAGLLTGARTMREKKIFNTPFAQYVKADFDVRYKVKLNKSEWANRFVLGLGFPYNNSAFLPFSKQYIVGGSNSIRGFPVYTLGPGSYLPSVNDVRFFQVIGGDYKLLFNTELRTPLFGKFSSALFIDAGNMWTKDTILFGVAGQLKKDFYKEIAVAAGVGLRYDASILLIRFDVGIPLRKPYLPEGQRWVADKIALGSGAWRGQNLVLNIAIGYPF